MPQSTLISWFKKPSTIDDGISLNKAELQPPSSEGNENQKPGKAALKVRENKVIGYSPSPTAVPTRTDSLREHIPSNAQIQQLTEATLPDFRRLNQLLLPIPYPDKFYKDIIADAVTHTITLAAFWQDNDSSLYHLVAGIRCRLLANSPASGTGQSEDKPSLYIASIGTLAPYRGHGLATALMNRVLVSASELYGIGTITAHVWEANDEARAWYAKLDFFEVQYEAMYYRRLNPKGAYLLERRVKTTDLLYRKASNVFSQAG